MSWVLFNLLLLSLNTLWAFWPFMGLLLSVAFCGTLAPRLWARYYGPITFFWSLPTLGYYLFNDGLTKSLSRLVHLFWLDYMPFISLLAALYIVAGGLKLRIHVHATPLANTLCLAAFTLLSGILGTTGSAMLGIHTVLHMNKPRKYQAHTVVFFIFLVCNIGGGLSSIGDPPLFLGFLKGVDFFWPTLHLTVPVLLISCILLGIYAVLDHAFFHKEPHRVQEAPKRPKINIEGKKQIFLALCVTFSLVLPSFLNLQKFFSPAWIVCLQLTSLAMIMGISFMITPMHVRKKDNWLFHPLTEVAVIFLGLFLTAEPLLDLLNQGPKGPFSFLMNALKNANGEASPRAYFWITGLLSSLLDNAPTYLVFFKTTGHSANFLMQEGSHVLKGLSLGAVFMGALTYIGNAPNLLTQALAQEEYRIKMPSFLTYMGIAMLTLIPLFVLIGVLFLPF